VPGVKNVEMQGQIAIVTYDPSRTTPKTIARGIEDSRVDTVSTIKPLEGPKC
jgi:hypothetical protein